MPNSALDAIDRRIIGALQADGRLSNADLAQRVGLSASPCLRRVRRLEHDGYIEGYRAMLSRDQIGLGLTVFVGVKIEGHANAEAAAFEQAVVALPGDRRLPYGFRRSRLPARSGRTGPRSLQELPAQQVA